MNPTRPCSPPSSNKSASKAFKWKNFGTSQSRIAQPPLPLARINLLVQIQNGYRLDERVSGGKRGRAGEFIFRESSDYERVRDASDFRCVVERGNVRGRKTKAERRKDKNEQTISETLAELKQFTADFPPELKGLALSWMIRGRTTLRERPEPIVDNEREERRRGVPLRCICPSRWTHVGIRRSETETGGVQGVFEGEIGTVAVPAIEERIQKYATDEISFNLLAVTNEKESAFRRELREAAESGDNENIVKLTDEIEDEMKRKEIWRDENIRRKHNYIPFIFEMLKCLAEKGWVGTERLVLA